MDHRKIAGSLLLVLVLVASASLVVAALGPQHDSRAPRDREAIAAIRDAVPGVDDIHSDVLLATVHTACDYMHDGGTKAGLIHQIEDTGFSTEDGTAVASAIGTGMVYICPEDVPE